MFKITNMVIMKNVFKLLSARSRVLLEKLTVTHLVMKCPTFY